MADWYPFACILQVHSCCQTARFHSFHGWLISPACILQVHPCYVRRLGFIPFTADWYPFAVCTAFSLPVSGLLGCFHIFAFVNSATVNTGCLYLFELEFLFSPNKIPRRGIAGSHKSYIFNFLGKLHVVFHSGCANLHSYQHCTKVPFSPYPHQHLSFLFFLIIVVLTGVRSWFTFPWWLTMLIIFSYLLTMDISMSSSEKCSFVSSALI